MTDPRIGKLADILVNYSTRVRGFTSCRNAFALADVPGDKMDLYNRHVWKEIHISVKDLPPIKCDGARFAGEFAFGVNPFITKPMMDTLFDEKISGLIHFTPGNSYDDCFNGNRSALHWDLVLMQDEASGGGEIWFDGRLVWTACEEKRAIRGAGIGVSQSGKPRIDAF
ncbi:MAG: aminopeptidase [Rectinemataceae bacterium]